MMAKMLTKLAGFRISKLQARRLVLVAVLGLALFLSLMYSFLMLIVVMVEKVVL